MQEYDEEWQLVPELSFYEEGDPPISGVYRISVERDRVEIGIEWTAVDGSSHSIKFGGPLDGAKHPSDQPGVSETSFTLVDDFTIDSAAYANGEEIAYASRRKSREGDLLATVQRGRRSDGTTFLNTQVYRRT